MILLRKHGHYSHVDLNVSEADVVCKNLPERTRERGRDAEARDRGTQHRQTQMEPQLPLLLWAL